MTISNCSMLLGSIQCASSSSISTGRWAARPTSCWSQISCSLTLRPCGPRAEALVAALGRDPHKGCGQRRASATGPPLTANSASSLASLTLRRIVAVQASSPLDLVEDGVEGRVSMEGRAEVAQPRVRLDGDTLAQVLQEARLADAGLTGEQDDLPHTLAGPAPAVEQQAEIVLAPDQGRQVLPVESLEPALGRAGRHYPEGSDRVSKAGDLLRSQVREVEQLAQAGVCVLSATTTVPARQAPASGQRGSASRRPPPPPARLPGRPGRRPRRDRLRCRPEPPAGRPLEGSAAPPRRWSRGRRGLPAPASSSCALGQPK